VKGQKAKVTSASNANFGHEEPTPPPGSSTALGQGLGMLSCLHTEMESNFNWTRRK